MAGARKRAGRASKAKGARKSVVAPRARAATAARQTRRLSPLSVRVPSGSNVRIDVRAGRDGTVIAVSTDDPPTPTLTTRQREVTRMLASTGMSQKQIAEKLGITLGSLRTHAMAVYRAMGVHSRPELVTKLNQTSIVRSSSDGPAARVRQESRGVPVKGS